jgi:hypothetical protein
VEYVEHKVRVYLDTYIAHPYWPEREKLINIQKESGLSRARTAQTRRKALDDYLASISMTRPAHRLAHRQNRPGRGLGTLLHRQQRHRAEAIQPAGPARRPLHRRC